ARRAEASRLATGLRRVATPFLVAWVVFLGAALLAAAAVAAQPLTVYAVVPREMLGQIAEHAWGQRESARADAGMTLFYSANNSRACLLALGLGALGGVPGYAVLAYNGALLGAVSGHALHLGLLPNLLAWLGPHGVPELTAIMLSGAIGWVLASAWMRPGSERRATRLAETGQDMAPLIGAAVFLVLAAAPLEGFISPLPLPLWVDGLIALGWISVLVFAVGRTLMLDSRSP
ncbi:MAG: stage II sporulation protein M, partial [Myxococcota bacterium]